MVLLLPAQLLLPVALVGLAAQQLQQKQENHVGKGSHAHIAHGGDIYLSLRAVDIDVKTAPLPHDAVGVLLPGSAVHMDHAAVGAARFQGRKGGVIVHGGIQQRGVVAGHDAVAPGHHDGAVHGGVIALHAVLVGKVVIAYIFCRGAVVHHKHPVPVLPGAGCGVYIGAILIFRPSGVDLLRVVGHLQHDRTGQLRFHLFPDLQVSRPAIL